MRRLEKVAISHSVNVAPPFRYFFKSSRALNTLFAYKKGALFLNRADFGCKGFEQFDVAAELRRLGFLADVAFSSRISSISAASCTSRGCMPNIERNALVGSDLGSMACFSLGRSLSFERKEEACYRLWSYILYSTGFFIEDTTDSFFDQASEFANRHSF